MSVERMVSDYFEGVLPSAPMKLQETYTENEMMRHVTKCIARILSRMHCIDCKHLLVLEKPPGSELWCINEKSIAFDNICHWPEETGCIHFEEKEL